jgi:hypothetical protein
VYEGIIANNNNTIQGAVCYVTTTTAGGGGGDEPEPPPENEIHGTQIAQRRRDINTQNTLTTRYGMIALTPLLEVHTFATSAVTAAVQKLLSTSSDQTG